MTINHISLLYTQKQILFKCNPYPEPQNNKAFSGNSNSNDVSAVIMSLTASHILSHSIREVFIDDAICIMDFHQALAGTMV